MAPLEFLQRQTILNPTVAPDTARVAHDVCPVMMRSTHAVVPGWAQHPD